MQSRQQGIPVDVLGDGEAEEVGTGVTAGRWLHKPERTKIAESFTNLGRCVPPPVNLCLQAVHRLRKPVQTELIGHADDRRPPRRRQRSWPFVEIWMTAL